MKAKLLKAEEDIFLDDINDAKNWWTFTFESISTFLKRKRIIKHRERMHYTFDSSKYIGRIFNFKTKRWE
jgi:hypothetical protein